MALNTKPVAIATSALAALAVALIAWQIVKAPATAPGGAAAPPGGVASGVVTGPGGARPSSPVSASPTAATPAPPPQPSAPMAEAAAPTVAPSVPATPGPAPKAASPAASPAAVPATPIKHRVAANPSRPPVLPTQANTVVNQELGRRTLWRYFYLEPLARRFVATVDNMGNKEPARDLWMIKPPTGDFKLYKSRKAPDRPMMAFANSHRYDAFVRWVAATDTGELLSLYARMYPLLQQTYVDLGHPDGYFNDRLIEVIDLLLATPVLRSPLRVQVANPPNSTMTSATPQKPRYEFVDPKLESLATGQKMLLRLGPDNELRIQAKLKALRRGLLILSRPVR